MMSLMILRAARPDEAPALSDLALRSKGHWGYDETFLEACRAALTIQPENVVAHRTTIAEEDGEVVGFCDLVGRPPDGEIGNLWVDPAHIGEGVGRLLWEHTTEAARQTGFGQLRVEADPNACGFYLSMGAVLVGAAPSGSIPGRALPVLYYTVT